MRHMRCVGEEEGGGNAQHKPSKPPILGLLAAQCLGAFNDNVYKMVVSLLAVNAAVSAGGGSGALSLISVIFILPFFLFSGYAGHAADACSKRTVLVVTKAFEIGAMGLGFFAFLSGRIELMLGVLFLMALQATFFSPAKYGILPEALDFEVNQSELESALWLSHPPGHLAREHDVRRLERPARCDWPRPGCDLHCWHPRESRYSQGAACGHGQIVSTQSLG